jgi:hypothetical protein
MTELVAATALLLAILSTADGPVSTDGNEHDTGRFCRLAVKVSAGDYPRQDGVVELELDLAQAAHQAGLSGTVDAATIVVRETDAAGKPVDTLCPHQFDAVASGKEGEKSLSGTLVFIMPGQMAAKAIRHFQVLFGTQRPSIVQTVTPLVKAQDDVDWQGQKSVRVETKGITWYYYREQYSWNTLT